LLAKTQTNDHCFPWWSKSLMGCKGLTLYSTYAHFSASALENIVENKAFARNEQMLMFLQWFQLNLLLPIFSLFSLDYFLVVNPFTPLPRISLYIQTTYIRMRRRVSRRLIWIQDVWHFHNDITKGRGSVRKQNRKLKNIAHGQWTG